MIALVTGILLVLVHPGFSFTFLAPFALIPLFYAALHSTRRVLYGWLAGVVYWFGLCYWIQSTLEQHGGMGGPESWALFVLFCFVKAIQMAAFAWIAPYAARDWWAAPALAGLWTVFEWTHNYTGFAWLLLGNAAVDWPFLAKLAPYTGVWGISFALGLVAAVAITRQWLWFLSFAILLFLPSLPAPGPTTHTALAVQPNLSEDAVWSPESIKSLDRHLTDLSLSAIPPNLVVWPEAPAPIYDQDRFLSDVPRLAHAPLLAGVVAHNDHGDPLNSALLISPEGRFIGRYDKVNLVPFGEFVPWPFGGLTRKVSSEAGEFAPGTVPLATNGIGTFICYEAVFPNYIRQFPLLGARALFNLSNDGWFGETAARYQHFLIVRMRAVENRRWLLRVTNNGITAAIDPAGRVHDQQVSYAEVAANLHYAEERSLTPYTKWGDWFVYLCMLSFVPAIPFAAIRYHRQK